MREPQIIEVRDAGFRTPTWVVVTLGRDGKHRYSYWHKAKYPDEIAAYVAATKLINGEIEGCDMAPRHGI